jgi:regulator of protease activity HflC (stomatin/prohibitin superfamily)
MEPVALIAIAILAVMGALASATIHVVPAGGHAVVMRAGVPVRSRASGFVHTLPGVERIHLVATRPPPLDPLTAHAITRDGVEIQLVASVLYRVTDPVRAAQATTDVRATTTRGIERALHHVVAQSELVSLLRDREEHVRRLVAQSPSELASIGVTVVDIDLTGVEVRVGAQLLSLLGT